MYKLTYFNIKARAEIARFIFALKEIPYEDVRVEKANWPELKKTLRWGQVPALEVKDKGVLLQSGAIARYLARKYDLTGADDFEAARCEEYWDTLSDLRVEWKKYFAETDATKQAELKKLLLEVHFPSYFGKFEQIKKENGGDFLVGQQLTWIDLAFATALEFYDQTVDPGVSKTYPVLKALQDKVYNIPQIKKWIQERPETPR